MLSGEAELDTTWTSSSVELTDAERVWHTSSPESADVESQWRSSFARFADAESIRHKLALGSSSDDTVCGASATGFTLDELI